MRLPDFLTPSEIEGIDLHEWENQTFFRINQLNHQLFHTTLAHLLRDCEGLEALLIACGKDARMVVSKGIEPVWHENAPKAAREHYRKSLKGLLERMLDAKVHHTLYGLFKQVVSPLLPREAASSYHFDKSKMTISREHWQEYLRVALPSELVARQLAHELNQNMESSGGTPATTSERARL